MNYKLQSTYFNPLGKYKLPKNRNIVCQLVLRWELIELEPSLN